MFFELDSKRWRSAGRLRQPIVRPGVLDLGARRLLIFERGGGDLAATAELWDEASGTTRTIALRPDMLVSHARMERPDENHPSAVRTDDASLAPRPD